VPGARVVGASSSEGTDLRRDGTRSGGDDVAAGQQDVQLAVMLQLVDHVRCRRVHASTTRAVPTQHHVISQYSTTYPGDMSGDAGFRFIDRTYEKT